MKKLEKWSATNWKGDRKCWPLETN